MSKGTLSTAKEGRGEAGSVSREKSWNLFGEKEEHLLMQASNTYLRRTTCGLRSRSRVNQAKGGRLEGGIGPPSHLPPGKVNCLF